MWMAICAARQCMSVATATTSLPIARKTKSAASARAKYYNKKNLTKEEQLEYENMKLRIENELLKKGYLMKGDGTIVKFTK